MKNEKGTKETRTTSSGEKRRWFGQGEEPVLGDEWQR